MLAAVTGILVFYTVGLKVRRVALDRGETTDDAAFAALALATPAAVVAACVTTWAL